MESTELKLQEVMAENDALRQQIKSLQSKLEAAGAIREAEKIPAELVQMVSERMAAGLDRETAVQAAKNQLAWDAEQAKKKAGH